MRQIREVGSTPTINPDLLTAAERIQYEGYLRRDEANAAIHALVKAGLPIKQISRRTGHSRRLVPAIVRGERTDLFRVRQNSLEPHLPWLDAQWDAGARNATTLWCRLTARGSRGSLRVIGEWATRRRRAERAGVEALQRVPSARTITRLMTTGRDRLTRAETVTVAAIEEGVPALVEAREIVATFQAMVRSITPAKLKAWIERANVSLITSFARGVAKDEVAVQAALTLPGPTARRRGRSPSSNWRNGRCMGAARLICWKLASPHRCFMNPPSTKSASEPEFHANVVIVSLGADGDGNLVAGHLLNYAKLQRDGPPTQLAHADLLRVEPLTGKVKLRLKGARPLR